MYHRVGSNNGYLIILHIGPSNGHHEFSDQLNIFTQPTRRSKVFPYSFFCHFHLLSYSSLLVICILLNPYATAARGATTATFGDWNMVCVTSPDTQDEECALVQSVIAEDQKNIGLAVSVLYTDNQRKRLIRVLAPLGVWLPHGLGLQVDGKTIAQMRFERCLVNGCFAEIELLRNIEEEIKNGKTATFVIFKTPEQGIGIPVSLRGFKDAIGQLH